MIFEVNLTESIVSMQTATIVLKKQMLSQKDSF